MKKILLILSISLVFICNAQAEVMLENKIALIPANGLLTADFVQERHLVGIPKPLISTGKIWIWKGRGLIWKTDTPFPSTILITSKGLYQVEDGKKNALIKMTTASGDHTIFDTLGNVLAGDFSQGIKGFTLQTLPEKQKVWQIRLLPAYAEIKNFISYISISGKKQLSDIVVSRPNGDQDIIHVKNQLLFESDSINKTLTAEQQAWFND
jgi:hypothetical protein